MGLSKRIGAGPVALDTAVFLYFIEEEPRYLPIVRAIFEGIHEGRWTAVTSAVTLLEVLVVPYRTGDTSLAESYELLLTRSRHLRLVSLDLPVLRAAAQLRATFALRTPDTLQLAAALVAGCRLFITNDRRLPTTVGRMEVLHLGELAG